MKTPTLEDLIGVIPMEFVYFAQYHEDGPVKIGRSIKVPKRMKALQLMCPYEVKLLGTFPGGAGDEAGFHRRFKDFHMRGEWFHATKEILAFIEECCETGEMVEQVVDSMASHRKPVVQVIKVRGSEVDSSHVSRRCKICQSPFRLQMDLMWAGGTSGRQVIRWAETQGASFTSNNISLHMRKHVTLREADGS
jgi:hypothetical protein